MAIALEGQKTLTVCEMRVYGAGSSFFPRFDNSLLPSPDSKILYLIPYHISKVPSRLVL